LCVLEFIFSSYVSVFVFIQKNVSVLCVDLCWRWLSNGSWKTKTGTKQTVRMSHQTIKFFKTYQSNIWHTNWERI
jgi:hypothetical protein